MSKKNNLFRVLTALFCVIMVITSMPIGAQASILGNEINEGADISDFEEEQEIKENVDSSISFVSEPSYTQQENENGVSTQQIGVKEDTDRNLSMDSFSSSNIGYDADSGNQPSGYSLFKHQGKTVKTTVPIGERVVFVAQW